MGELDGPKALVTGGASGIGLTIATTFASEGASVVVLDRAALTRAMAADGMPDGVRVNAVNPAGLRLGPRS